MSGEISRRLPALLALAGALAVLVGAWLPWVAVAPWVDAVIQVDVPDTRAGVHARDYTLVGVLLAGLAAAAYYRNDRRGGTVAAVTGGLIVAVAVTSLAAVYAGSPVSPGAYVPGPGVILTVLGGLLLVEAGRRHRATVAGGGDGPVRAETVG